MTYTTLNDKKTSLFNCEHLYFDEDRNCEVWRKPNGKLVYVKDPVVENTFMPLEERQFNNRGFKIQDDYPHIEVFEATYDGSKSDPVPAYFNFKGVVRKPDGKSSVVDIESKNSLSLAKIAEIILD